MDNLINFDVEAKAAPSSPPVLIPCLSVPKVIINEPVLIGLGQASSDMNNPFDMINHKANFADDPFEFTKRTNERNFDDLMDGSQFSFDCFSSVSSNDPSQTFGSSKESSLTSAGSQKTAVCRSQSDSSVISSKSNNKSTKANVTVDNIQLSKQLLKLSFLNSPNSPMKRSTNKLVVENALSEARRIAQHYSEPSDLSFEDLNNVSQPVGEVSDSSMMIDSDLQAMKVNNLPPSTPSTMNADKIAMFQERLRLIKKEDPDEFELPTVTDHSSTPVKTEVLDSHKGNEDETELDQLLRKLKTVITGGNKGEAKKHLNRLNELLEKRKDPNELKNTLHVQPIVRQDTFEIDENTGNRKYKEKLENDEKVDAIKKLSELLKTMTVEVHTINFGEEESSKVMFVVPTPVSTPVKNPPRNSKSAAPQAQSALKSLECKKLGTPMKRQSIVGRSSTFTTPRPMTTSKAVHPYEQKLNVPSRAGAVRKSLLNTIDTTLPTVKPRTSTITKPPTKLAPATAPRRSVSMRASTTAAQAKPSPVKNVPRPSTGAPYATPVASRRLPSVPATLGRPSTVAQRVAPATRSRTLSEQKKPVSQFKPPSGLRKPAVRDDKGSLV